MCWMHQAASTGFLHALRALNVQQYHGFYLRQQRAADARRQDGSSGHLQAGAQKASAAGMRQMAMVEEDQTSS